MIRIPRATINKAVDALLECAKDASDVEGRAIVFRMTREGAEAALLGALSIIAPSGGIVTAGDVQFVTGFGSPEQVIWPPRLPRVAA